MKQRLSVLIVLIFIMLIITFGLKDYPFLFVQSHTTLSFGFLLLTGYLVSDIFAKINLPRITGYLFSGILFGPYILNFVTMNSMQNLKFFDDLALNFIALTAGGELKTSEIGKRLKSILSQVSIAPFFVFIMMTLSLLFLKIDLFQGKTLINIVVISCLCGIISIARSPSSAIAIISETGAKGPFTEIVLSVTVITDVLIIPLFVVAASLGSIALAESGSVGLTYLIGLLSGILMSVVSGILIAGVIHIYFTYVGIEKSLFLLSVVYGTACMSESIASFLWTQFHVHFDLEPMIICMTAGFIVQNFLQHGRTLIDSLERSSLPVYVLFFSITGASLDINVLKNTWHVAILLVFLRIVFLCSGSFFTGRIAGDPNRFNQYYGLSFITQAGVSIGLVKIIADEFSNWGSTLATILIAMIIINQIIGPVAMKLAFDRIGESKSGRQKVTVEKKKQ